MTALRNISLLLLVFLANLVQAQDKNLKEWKKQAWNLHQDKKDEIIRLDPDAVNFVLQDGDMWRKPANADTSFTFFAIMPSYLGFKEGYNHKEFVGKVLEMGFTTPPKSAVAQLYIESENLGKPVYFPTIPVRNGNKSYVYAVGPNEKGGTPTKKDHDLFLKELGRHSHLDIWIFAKDPKKK